MAASPNPAMPKDEAIGLEGVQRDGHPELLLTTVTVQRVWRLGIKFGGRHLVVCPRNMLIIGGRAHDCGAPSQA